MTTKQYSLTLPQRFDFNFHKAFTKFNDGMLSKEHVKELALDFTRVDYIDSSALGMLVLLKRKASVKNVQVFLKGARGNVRDILDMANMQNHFVIES